MRRSLFYSSVILFLFSFIFLCSKPDALHAVRNPLYDSDQLFPFSLFNGILNSGNTDWMFSGAIPYFPDLFFGFIFWFLLRNIHLTIAVYAVFQVTLITSSILFLSKCLFGKNYVIYSLIMIFSSIPIFLLSSGEMLFFYTLTWYKKVGVMSLIFIGLGLLIRLVETSTDSKKLFWRRLLILDILIIIAVASDALFIVQYVTPAIVVLVCLGILSKIQTRKMIIEVTSLSISVGIGLSTYNLPKLWGSGRINFMDGYVHLSLGRLAYNWNEFSDKFASLIGTRVWMVIVWICFYTTCLIIAGFTIWVSNKKERGYLRRRSLVFLLFLLTQLPAIIGASVLSGSIEVWYFNPIVFIPLMWGWPFIAGFFQGLLKLIRHRYVIVSSLIAIALTIIVGIINSNLISTFPNLADYYPSSIACVDQKVGNLGLKRGIAQYWLARPITLLSKKGVVVVQVLPNLLPLHWENNSDWYKDDFEFIVVDQPASTPWSISKESVLSRFGEPAIDLSCPPSEILVYNRPSDTLFRRQFDYTLIKPDNLPGNLDMTYPAAVLPSQVGSLEGTFRVANDGTAQGFLTYGPYLSLTTGKYDFQIKYKAQQGSQVEVGRWDVVAWNDGKAEILSEGEMAPGNEYVSGEFIIKEKSAVVEVRTYYEGSGVLSVESIHIEGTK